MPSIILHCQVWAVYVPDTSRGVETNALANRMSCSSTPALFSEKHFRHTCKLPSYIVSIAAVCISGTAISPASSL